MWTEKATEETDIELSLCEMLNKKLSIEIIRDTVANCALFNNTVIIIIIKVIPELGGIP